MPALSSTFEGPRWESDKRYWRRRFRPTFERLRSAQLRDNSLYSNLRSFIPFFVLGIEWLVVTHLSPTSDVHRLLRRSITVRHLLLALGIVILWNLWLSLSVYERRSPRRDVVAEVIRLTANSICCGLLLLVGNITRGEVRLGVTLAVWTGLALMVASYGLLGSFIVGAALSPRLMRKRPALIVGTGVRAEMLKARLKSQYSPFELFGCVDDEYHGDEAGRNVYLGPIEGLAELLKTHPIEIVLIGLPIRSKYDDIQRVIEICETIGVESHYMRDVFETSRARLEINTTVPHHFTVLSTLAHNPKRYVKRLIDILGAILLLILFSPVMFVTALAVKFTSAGPVFFIQQRYGRHRKRFPMFKFRSMVVDAEKRQAALESQNEAQGPVFKLKSDPRVTKVGAFIRKMSIDELPQLFNVLRGEMSLVGPRPLPLRDVSNFEESWLLRRFSVRPGLTCLWQIRGRSNTSFDDWIKQDLEYIDGWSLSLDMKILFLTVPAVLKGSGAV
jgi:exopolysaccharide biosynthesis polyprenyl glycosylphosphotransferase